MPTPIAHTGLALGLALAGDPEPARILWDRVALRRSLPMLVALVVIANAADVDFIPGVLTGSAVAFHHGPTHSLAFALGITVIFQFFLAARKPGSDPAPDRRTPLRPSLWVVGMCALSHPLLDWLTGEPGADVQKYGIQAFWPFSPARFMVAHPVFGPYHIDTMGLLGGVFNLGAVANLAGELGFAAGAVILGLGARWARSRQGA